MSWKFHDGGDHEYDPGLVPERGDSFERIDELLALLDSEEEECDFFRQVAEREIWMPLSIGTCKEMYEERRLYNDALKAARAAIEGVVHNHLTSEHGERNEGNGR